MDSDEESSCAVSAPVGKKRIPVCMLGLTPRSPAKLIFMLMLRAIRWWRSYYLEVPNIANISIYGIESVYLLSTVESKSSFVPLSL